MKAATEGTESLAQPLQTARLDKCLVVQRLEVAELREADGMTRHFISFDGRHFVEVNRSVDPMVRGTPATRELSGSLGARASPS